MRSQSAAFVQPYDVFLMTMLQELLANELNVGLGYYKHFCGSYHYFVDEEKMVDEIYYSQDYSEAMPKMYGGIAEVKKILTFEKLARLDTLRCNEQGMVADYNYLINELISLNLPRYWNYIGEVLIAKAIHITDYKGPLYNGYINTLVNNPFKKLLTQFEG
jgi:hypothetical protein